MSKEALEESLEESLLVVLLSEAVGGPAPPDLSASIFSRLQQPEGVDAPQAPDTGLRGELPHRDLPNITIGRRPSRNLSAVLSLIAAIAAVVLVLVMLQGGRQNDLALQNPPPQQNPLPAAADDAQTSADAAVPAAAEVAVSVPGTVADAGPQRPEDIADTRPRRTRPMSMGSLPFSTPQDVQPTPSQTAYTKAANVTPLPGRAIAIELQQRFDVAWKHLAVEPTPAASAQQVANRLSGLLGVPVSPEQAGDPDAIADLVRQPQARRVVADRLLTELLGPAWPRLRDEPKETLVRFVADSMNEGQRFDVVTRELFLGADAEASQEASQAWLTALAGERNVPITQQVGHGLLDLDLGCARCHDHPLNSQIRQQDFWALAALFENGLQYSRNSSGEPLVQAASNVVQSSGEPLSLQRELPKGQFYELPDGRQRVALPSVPPQWLDLQIDADGTAPGLSDLESVAQQWDDNPRLARSLVNRLWTAVYGRALTGSVSDPDAPPSEAHFEQLRDFLAAQLRAHDFDLAELVSWVVTAPPMQRSVVLEPQSEQAAFASDEQLAQAEFMHRTFAGYESSHPQLGFDGLLAMAMRWNGGGSIASLPALAQPLPSEATVPVVGSPSEAERLENWLRTSFPEKENSAAALPAQWLDSIEEFEQQARHLYYAAGFWKPTEQQMAAALELREASGSSAVALKQLWWALRNSR